MGLRTPRTIEGSIQHVQSIILRTSIIASYSPRAPDNGLGSRDEISQQAKPRLTSLVIVTHERDLADHTARTLQRVDGVLSEAH
jgi:hypothetical protein